MVSTTKLYFQFANTKFNNNNNVAIGSIGLNLVLNNNVKLQPHRCI